MLKQIFLYGLTVNYGVMGVEIATAQVVQANPSLPEPTPIVTLRGSPNSEVGTVGEDREQGTGNREQGKPITSIYDPLKDHLPPSLLQQSLPAQLPAQGGILLVQQTPLPGMPSGNNPPLVAPERELPAPPPGTEMPPEIPTVPTPIDELTPNPNPLFLPSQPQEVETQKLVPLTLEEALELAKRNNRDLQIARSQLDAARANLQQAEAELYPTLALQGSARRVLDTNAELGSQATRRGAQAQIDKAQAQIDEAQAQIDAGANGDAAAAQQQAAQQQENVQQLLDNAGYISNTALTGQLNLNYAIYSRGRQARIDQASEQVLDRELEVQKTEEDLRLQVALAYYNLQQADEAVRINDSNVKDRSKRVEGIKLLLEAAVATRADLLFAQTDLGNAIQELRNSQADQQTRRSELATLLSLPASVTPVTADPVKVTGEWNLALPETLVLALKTRVELQQFLARRRQFEAEREVQLAAVTPQLGLFATYDLLQFYTDAPDTPNNFTFQPRGFADGYSVGLTLNWTFFDGGAAAAGARRADANIASTDQEYARQANQIQLEVKSSFVQLPTQLQNVRTAFEALNQAQEGIRAAQLRFEAGVTTQIEVLDAQRRLVDAERNLVDAVLRYNRSLAQLRRAVGTINKLPAEVRQQATGNRQ